MIIGYRVDKPFHIFKVTCCRLQLRAVAKSLYQYTELNGNDLLLYGVEINK